MHHLGTGFSNLGQKSDAGCGRDPIAELERLFVQVTQQGRIDAGQTPARRPVFLRLHGVAHGRFEIAENLPKALRLGLFRKRRYDAWVRFSSDIPDPQPDFKSTVGIAVKLFGVAGKKCLKPEIQAATADFVFQNMNVFMVDGAPDMCRFISAAMGGSLDRYLDKHPRTRDILAAMAKEVPSVLTTDYWSCIPFRFGDDRYVKYKLEPVETDTRPAPDFDDPNYLRKDLEHRLRSGEVRFRFMIQLQQDADAMPLDAATVPWSEELSPPIPVATLILPQQDVTARGQADYGESLAFNPWRVPKQHQPVGSIAEARQVVYRASARLRRNTNGQPVGEPVEPRPCGPYPPGREIVAARIHPGIGVARLGNSRRDDGFYIGPEVPHPPHTGQGRMRDEDGAIKRQAARFRIYGIDADGRVVREITPSEAGIQWTVHLVNKKASWYRFEAALDLPEAHSLRLPQRNAAVKASDRRHLVIDPGPRSIAGQGTHGPEYRFDTGTFQGITVPLGEIRTDEEGRLLVLGGYGTSGSPCGKPIYSPSDPQSFNNADGWYDDIADGTVEARVTMNGRELPVESSWVVVAPPNYGPDFVSWRTFYDLLTDVYIENGMLPVPDNVSFTDDVLPILLRMSRLQWVNAGFAAYFSRDGAVDFEDPALRAKLSHTSPGDPYRELRRNLANMFRPSDTDNDDPRPWPWIIGDAFGTFEGSPHRNLALSPVREDILRRWVDGDFVDDWQPDHRDPESLDQIPIERQPAALDRAALDFCIADAFHPGCEMTWPMRHASMYSAPFRLRRRSESRPDADIGRVLTQKAVLRTDGPLYGQSPGDVTRWMALPWQADTAFCRSGYTPAYDPYLPTFWPARVPNHVLIERDYEIVVDTGRPRQERLEAFHRRRLWLDPLVRDRASPVKVMERMVERFGELGILEARPGVEDDAAFPSTMWVESRPGTAEDTSLSRAAAGPSNADSAGESTLSQAGWTNQEQLEAFHAIRIRHRD